MSKMQS